MPEENSNEITDPVIPVTPEVKAETDLVTRLVAEKVEEQLKEIKTKLDNAFAQRDEANRKLAEKEQAEKEEKIRKLKEEGKHQEVLEQQLAEEKARAAVLEKRNMELSRDVDVRAALNGLDFKNERAATTCFKQVIEQLVQNDKGEWVHKSGVKVLDFVMAFAKDEENSYLFKVKTNSGGGSNLSTTAKPATNAKKSLFEHTQEEVLAMAREGKLRNRG